MPSHGAPSEPIDLRMSAARAADDLRPEEDHGRVPELQRSAQGRRLDLRQVRRAGRRRRHGRGARRRRRLPRRLRRRRGSAARRLRRSPAWGGDYQARRGVRRRAPAPPACSSSVLIIAVVAVVAVVAGVVLRAPRTGDVPARSSSAPGRRPRRRASPPPSSPRRTTPSPRHLSGSQATQKVTVPAHLDGTELVVTMDDFSQIAGEANAEQFKATLKALAGDFKLIFSSVDATHLTCGSWARRPRGRTSTRPSRWPRTPPGRREQPE